MIVLGAMSVPLALAAAALEPGSTNDLTLRDFVQRVIERNESLQVRMLELKVAGKQFKAERGVFEPELLFSYDRVENKRENTAEQRRSTGVATFDEENNLYNASVEGLIPTGAKLRLGYFLRDLRNNLQDPPLGTIFTNRTRGEYQTFAGINLTQPLLKNAWFPATLANVRLAALASDLAYQEYRRQMMRVITTAEASYWDLYLARQQVRYIQESAELAESLVRDNQARLQAGRGSELEVLEAKAGLALRKAKLAEAEQNYSETATAMLTLIAESAAGPTPTLRPVDAPNGSGQVPPFAESGRIALETNPDYLSQVKRLEQENVRFAYAKNQRLPQLDLKASYGLNGLGADPQSSWDDVQHRGFPSFSAGIEWHVPLGGGIKARNELGAAKLRKQQALITLKATETQILNTLHLALQKIQSTHGAIGDYEQIVAFNRNLLDTELDRLQVGKVDSRRVLEVEANLFEARNAVVEARVKNERARLELELVQGTVLQSRNLDLPQKEIEQRTESMLRQAGVTDRQYREWLKDLRLNYEKPTPPSETGAAPDKTDAAPGRP
jgi:outer membrane protein